jgi:hypothetical protein
MAKRRERAGLLILLIFVGACSSPLIPTPEPTPTSTPTPTPTPHPATCTSLDAVWAVYDWPAVLTILDGLEANGLTCGHDSLDTKRYAAHFNYGTALEASGDVEAAIEQYRAALALDSRGQLALDALARLDALPDPTQPACNPRKLAAHTPDSSEPFVTADGNRLIVDGEAFYVRGVNYYPRHAPWHQFLTDASAEDMAEELDLIADAGFNTLRIFLWYEPLFTCAPEDAVPNPEAFAKLDALIALADERDLRLIVTLNDLPDLHYRPLYTDWERYDAQTAFIASRYRDEPAILAWDLRNEGDLDYGARDGGGRFEQTSVLTWLSHTAAVVRANDERHLLTAGWWGDATETAEVVDILSFHHWLGSRDLAQRIDAVKARSDKPILVEEMGFSTLDGSGEKIQAELLTGWADTANQDGAAGWLVWTAFDFDPVPGQTISPEHGFGLWRIDLTPKPALDALLRDEETPDE